MSKIFINLNKIPSKFAADMLGFRYISRLDVVHKKEAALVAETDKFVKTFIPGARFNNKNFTYRRFLEDTVEVPTIRVFDHENKLVDTLETSNLDQEQIKLKLMLLEARIAERIDKEKRANK